MLFVVGETDREIVIRVAEREADVNVLSFYTSFVNSNGYAENSWYRVVVISRP